MDMEMQSTVRELTIEDLPIEIMVNIIKFVPKSQTKNISLVNKKFYDVVCEAEKFKYPLKLSNDEFYDWECLQMLRNTKRKFDRLKISVDVFYQQELNELLDIHGKTIMRMNIFLSAKQRTNSRKWIEMFEKVPNLKELKLRNSYLIININGHAPLPIAPGHELLPNLKSLKVYLENGDLKVFFDCLNPISLEKLKVKSNWKDFEGFISRQTGVKDLSIPHYYLTQSFAHLPQLENFTVFMSESEDAETLDDPKSDQLMKLIQAHPDIKAVHVMRERFIDNLVPLRGDVIKALCHLPSLEQLSVKLDDVNNSYDMADFTHCSAKDVRVDYETIGFHPTFNEILKMKNIEKLRINNMNQNVNTELSQKIRHLIIDDVYDCNIAKILRNFQGLEKLEAEYITYPDPVYTYAPDGLIHWRLNSFNFPEVNYFHYTFNGDIVGLLEALPNVQTFKFTAWGIYFSTELLRTLLSLRNLKNLNMRFWFRIHDEEDFNIGNLDADDIKQIYILCKRLKKFRIEFVFALQQTIEALERELSEDYFTESYLNGRQNSFIIVRNYAGKDKYHW